MHCSASTLLVYLQVYIHTHTRLTALCLGLPGWAGTRKVKPIWILLKQETVSSSGIGWAICKSAPRSRQIITPSPHHSVFYRPDALPATQPTTSKHWRHAQVHIQCHKYTWHRIRKAIQANIADAILNKLTNEFESIKRIFDSLYLKQEAKSLIIDVHTSRTNDNTHWPRNLQALVHGQSWLYLSA